MGHMSNLLVELTDAVAGELGVEDDDAWEALELWIQDNVDPPDVAAKISPVAVANQWKAAHPGCLTVPTFGRRHAARRQSFGG